MIPTEYLPAEALRPEAEAVPASAPITVVRTSMVMARRITLTLTIIPFLGFLVGMRLLWGGISGLDLTLLISLYSVSILGVTVGYHRMLTHRAFDAPRSMRVALALAGSLAVEGSVIPWVADHRRHHMFTDRPGDPHSPHLVEGTGLGATLEGLYHAHVGWFFAKDATRVERFAPDLLKDPALVRVSNLFPLWTVISFALAPGIAFALTGSPHAALTALVWGSLVRIFLLHHVTWSINSICHFYGRRPYESDDYSTNNWLMSLVSFGEGWHNNHHAFPNSAFHGLEWWQVDIAGATIRLMRVLHLARNVHSPSARQRELKVVLADPS